MNELADAFDVFIPFYEEGDDGDSIRLALEAIAGWLGDMIDEEEFEDLTELLEDLSAPQSLRDMVDHLYEVAENGSYGEGLSAKDAEAINDLVQDIYGPLEEFLMDFAEDEEDVS